MQLHVAHSFLPKHRTVRTSIVMDHFGIDFERGQHIIADGLELPIIPGQIILFTGASGSGKSSLMQATAAQLQSQHSEPTNVIDLDQLELGTAALIDALPLPVEQGLTLLSACGLGEAHLLLRTPQELSDGQRYRFRLALALSRQPDWIVADEFTATLDRTLAKVIAFNIERLARRHAVGFLLATTHTDVTADLAPDLQVECSLDGEIKLSHSTTTHSGTAAVDLKKKASHSTMTSGSHPRPVATGRISLGGITAATTSE